MRCHAAPKSAAAPIQRRTPAKDKLATSRMPPPEPTARHGLPTPLRANLEALSGFSLADVRIHRDSPEPARLGALAFTRGSDIHLGPGQEKHLPHEAWHVVQQKQGRVQATTQMKRPGMGQGEELEAEADEMGDQLESDAEFESLEDETDPLDDQAACERDQTATPHSSDDEKEPVGGSAEHQSLGDTATGGALVDVGGNAPDTDADLTEDDRISAGSDYSTPDNGPRRKKRNKNDQVDCTYEEKARYSKGGLAIPLPAFKLERKPVPGQRPININLQISFNQNSDQALPLTAAATNTLNRIVNILIANPAATAWVSGSTSLRMNQTTTLTLGGVQSAGTGSQLANARSITLTNILIGLGAPAGQLATGQPRFGSTLSARVRITFAGATRLHLSFKTKTVRIFTFIKGKSLYAKAQRRKNKALSKQHRKLAKKFKKH
ncbi:MAG: DUF4157 domain-containing protein [Allosphingosinicella sp.]